MVLSLVNLCIRKRPPNKKSENPTEHPLLGV
jgi:hypothetical protein